LLNEVFNYINRDGAADLGVANRIKLLKLTDRQGRSIMEINSRSERSVKMLVPTKDKPRKVAAGYIRVSSKDQVEGYSLDFQTEAIEKYCKEKGYRLKRIYAEEGVSGKTVSKRDAFKQMCRDGYAGKFDVVIVWKFDRFTRDIETGVKSFFGLKNSGIKIVSLHEGLTSDSDDMMALLNIGMADKYRKDLIANIKRGTKTKLKSGDPQIGLAGQPIARYWDEKDKIFKLKEDEAAEWRLAAKQYLEGVSAAEIGRLSKERGSRVIPTTSVNVRKHLRDGLGDTHTITYDGEVFEFRCEPIVDEDMRQAIIRLMDKRRQAPNVRPDKFLLSGKIRCAECGRKLTCWNENRKPDSLRLYIHAKADRNGCNGLKSIRVDYIDAAVLKECFLAFGGNKKAYEEAIKEHLPDPKARSEVEDEIKSLKRLLSKNERDKELILDKVINEDLNSSIIDGLNKRIEQIEYQIGITQNELQEKEQHLASMPTVEEYKEAADKIRAYWKRVCSGWRVLEQMSWQDNKYLIDEMFDGVDEDGRPYGVYVRHIAGKVFDYEIYGKFVAGALFMKKENSHYISGPELEPIYAEWDRKFQAEKAAYRAKEEKSKSCSLEMGDTGLEPVTSRV
jgi:site-specific DNA recombinase